LTGEVGAARSPDKIVWLWHETWGEKRNKILSPPHRLALPKWSHNERKGDRTMEILQVTKARKLADIAAGEKIPGFRR
jgi:hypothetical protein